MLRLAGRQTSQAGLLLYVRLQRGVLIALALPADAISYVISAMNSLTYKLHSSRTVIAGISEVNVSVITMILKSA